MVLHGPMNGPAETPSTRQARSGLAHRWTAVLKPERASEMKKDHGLDGKQQHVG